MKKEIQFTIPEMTIADPDTYHSSSRIEVSTNKSFTNVADEDNVLLSRDNADDQSIFRYTKVLDFPNHNTTYYFRTTVGFSNGKFEPPSRIMKITASGLSSAYQYSSTIIKDPEVILSTPTTDPDDLISFKTPPMILYKGEGKHTHTSWRLIGDGKVIWERLRDNSFLTEISLPIKLESNKTYYMEAQHHIGDIESNWGKKIFTTGVAGSDVFSIRQFGKDSDTLDIKKGQDNFLIIESALFDSTTFNWHITANNVTVMKDTNVARELVGLPIKTLVIPGTNLVLNTQYVLHVQLVRSHDIVERQYRFTVTEPLGPDIDFLDTVSHRNTFITESTLTSSRPVLLGEKETQLFIKDGKLAKVVKTGHKYVERALATDVTVPAKAEFETRVDVIDGKLLIQYTEQVQVDNSFVNRRKMRIFSYDPYNVEIFNPSTYKTLDLGVVVSKIQDLSFSHYGYNTIEVVKIDENGDSTLHSLNLNTGATVTGTQAVSITNTAGSIVPKIAYFDTNFALLVSGTKVTLYNRKSTTGLILGDIADNELASDQWVDMLTKANGDIMLVGLKTINTGSELCNFLVFNKDTMLFEVANSKATPKVSDTTDLKRPNIFNTSDNFIGLGYLESTIWIS